MGAGAYLGTRARIEVLSSELERSREEAGCPPQRAPGALLHELEHEGLSREVLLPYVQLLSSAAGRCFSTSEVKMYGGEAARRWAARRSMV